MAVVRVRAPNVAEVQTAKDANEVMSKLRGNGLLRAPVDVFAIAEYIGVEVVEEIMSDDMSGFLEFRGGRWVAGVNALHHENRRRFSIAHELAHYLLHREARTRFEDEVFTRRQGKRDKVENEADELAASILMPEDEFRSSISSGINSVDSLAKKFAVSAQAARYRALNLGYKIRDRSQ